MCSSYFYITYSMLFPYSMFHLFLYNELQLFLYNVLYIFDLNKQSIALISTNALFSQKWFKKKIECVFVNRIALSLLYHKSVERILCGICYVEKKWSCYYLVLCLCNVHKEHRSVFKNLQQLCNIENILRKTHWSISSSPVQMLLFVVQTGEADRNRAMSLRKNMET